MARSGLIRREIESDLKFDGDLSGSQESAGSLANFGTSTGSRLRSISDAAAHRNHIRELTLSPISVHFHNEKGINGIMPPPQTPTSPHPPRPTEQRSRSTSRIELRSRYHDPAATSAELQHQLVEPTKLMSLFLQPRWTQHDAASKSHPHPDQPNPCRHNTESSSDLNVGENFAQLKMPELRTLLKPCIKQRSKSASTMSPSGIRRKDYIKNALLRRVKTVEFVESGKSILSMQPPEVKSKEVVGVAAIDFTDASPSSTTTSRNVHRAMSCPNRMNIAKSDVASPEVTRTDVHVVALASLWSGGGFVNESIDPATPNMQNVNSKNGSYEVIWDDIPREYSLRPRRRNSSGGQAWETVDSTAFCGLERVNTKLTDWRGSRDRSSESFKPTIMVFPDDDGRPIQYDCKVEDSVELLVPAPPNSQTSSCLPSRPASAPVSRRVSEEETALQPFLEKLQIHHKCDRANSAERILHSEHRPGRIIRASRTRRRLSAPRKLSNIEEADLHFRGHRDSVTIARSRLIDSGGISPELFAHRDSVLIAKKRMKAKNQTTSAARRQRSISSEVLEDGVSLPSTAKEHATQTLRNQSLDSILNPHQTATQRHIRS